MTQSYTISLLFASVLLYPRILLPFPQISVDICLSVGHNIKKGFDFPPFLPYNDKELPLEDTMIHPQIVQHMKLFLLDMDGTLCRGDRLYDFTIPLLRRIRETGGRYLFLTNNSSLCVEDQIRRLKKLGILSTREDFLTAAQATARYLQQNHPGKRLYVCGTLSLKRELCGAGFEVVEEPDRAECLLMGFDRELTFRKLRDVCRLLQTRDIPYLATNPDIVCPTEFGFVPNCGSICDMLFHVTNKRPLVIGKPDPLMPRMAMERLGVAPSDTCCIGDQLSTDIRCGLSAGITTMLVLSGVTTREHLVSSPIRPHFVLKDAGEVLAALQ